MNKQSIRRNKNSEEENIENKAIGEVPLKLASLLPSVVKDYTFRKIGGAQLNSCPA